MPKKKKDELEEKLVYKPKFIWNAVDAKKRKEIFGFAEDYKRFIGEVKTEREFVNRAREMAEKAGFVPMEKAKGKVGEKIYVINRNKSMALIVLGRRDIAEGSNIVVAHIDAPRIDLKPHPLYEDKETFLALLKTHYYGGIKKYQWVNIPLALHGMVYLKGGKTVDIVIGEDEKDPVLMLPDLLPHLARKVQGERKLFQGIEGEEMNLLIGSVPLKKDEEGEQIKLNILKILNDRYGITEKDLIGAELEVVPAEKPRDVGLDKGLIAAYGQDDRVCGYTTLRAILEIDRPEKTAIALLMDKEEIGSETNTGSKSSFIEYLYSQLISLEDGSFTPRDLYGAMTNAEVLSADVDAIMDPSFKQVHEPLNAAKASHGIVLTKYTGAGGKYSSNDAHAEFVGKILELFDENGVFWQAGELGKVDEGGGGTIAKFMAERNMDVVDCGPGLLSMHSPMEIASKADIWAAYRAYRVFFEKNH